MFVREGGGVELVEEIRAAERAVVLISVPWSGPERVGRVEFLKAAARCGEKCPALGVAWFRLEFDEDASSEGGSIRSGIRSSPAKEREPSYGSSQAGSSRPRSTRARWGVPES
jgi:hypothetical protein